MQPTAGLLVTPLSGPLGEYGRAGARALSLLGSLRLEVVDANPDPAAAMLEGLAGRPDVVFGPYGSAPALAAVRATGRAVWNHGGSTSALRRPDFPAVINVLAPASTYFDGSLRVLRAAGAALRTVALVRGSSGFAADVAAGAAATATTLGFTVTEVVFDPGHATDAASRVPEADVLLVVGRFEDEVALARSLLTPGRWRAAAFVGAGTDEVLAALPATARDGLLGPAQWVPSAAPPEPAEGPSADWFATAYRRQAGADPPYPAAQAVAAGLLALRCLRDADGDSAVLAAAAALDTTTLYGRFRLDPVTGLQAGHEVLTVQWQDGVRRVVWPAGSAEAGVSVGG